MNQQRPSCNLLEVVVKALRRPIGRVTKIVHAGSSTKVRFNRIEMTPEIGRMHLTGHEGPQCNMNGYIEKWCNPQIHPNDPNVVCFSFFNQAFRSKENFFRIYDLCCEDEETARKVRAVLLLGATAAREYDEHVRREEEETQRALDNAVYNADTENEEEADSNAGEEEVSEEEADSNAGEEEVSKEEADSNAGEEEVSDICIIDLFTTTCS